MQVIDGELLPLQQPTDMNYRRSFTSISDDNRCAFNNACGAMHYVCFNRHKRTSVGPVAAARHGWAASGRPCLPPIKYAGLQTKPGRKIAAVLALHPQSAYGARLPAPGRAVGGTGPTRGASCP